MVNIVRIYTHCGISLRVWGEHWQQSVERARLVVASAMLSGARVTAGCQYISPCADKECGRNWFMRDLLCQVSGSMISHSTVWRVALVQL